MKKLTNKQRSYISNLWFISELRQTKPNLVIQYTEQNNTYYFTIGIYSFNSITGCSKIEPLPNMTKLTFEQTKLLLTIKK